MVDYNLGHCWECHRSISHCHRQLPGILWPPAFYHLTLPRPENVVEDFHELSCVLRTCNAAIDRITTSCNFEDQKSHLGFVSHTGNDLSRQPKSSDDEFVICKSNLVFPKQFLVFQPCFLEHCASYRAIFFCRCSLLSLLCPSERGLFLSESELDAQISITNDWRTRWRLKERQRGDETRSALSETRHTTSPSRTSQYFAATRNWHHDGAQRRKQEWMRHRASLSSSNHPQDFTL